MNLRYTLRPYCPEPTWNTTRCATSGIIFPKRLEGVLQFKTLRHHINMDCFSLSTTLYNLGYLYALYSLDKHLVYFYEGGYTNGPEFARYVRENILRLCAKIKPDALGVIDALAPPDFVVNSVLGKSDGKVIVCFCTSARLIMTNNVFCSSCMKIWRRFYSKIPVRGPGRLGGRK